MPPLDQQVEQLERELRELREAQQDWNQLSFGQLLARLESDWQPDLTSTGQGGSVRGAALARRSVDFEKLDGFEVGSGSHTGDGLTALNTVTVGHSLGATPQIVLVEMSAPQIVHGVPTRASTSFNLAMRHIDNTTWTDAVTYFYLAIL